MFTKKSLFVLVRCYGAGVHCGTLVQQDAKTVTLANARRVWRWRGANTLNELSQSGPAEDWTRISEPVPSIVLSDAIEVMPCSEDAQAKLSCSRWPQ